MLNIKTPQLYINEPNALEQTGNMTKYIGNNALIIWSKSSKKVTEYSLKNTLYLANVNFEEILFDGYPTLETAKKYARIIKNNNIQFIIAIGGGRVIDVSKAAGDLADIPVVSIPTIAATCAPWAALSVLYTEEGDFEHFRLNKHSPKIIIADTTLLAHAPIRYVRAGIIDTLAKWYEISATHEESNSDFTYLNTLNSTRLIYDFFSKNAKKAIESIESQTINETVQKTFDAIFYLAGNVGSYVGEKAYSGFAHPFYHSSRRIESTRKNLHGELVAFGLLLQAVLENRSQHEIKEMIEQFSDLNVAFTLGDIGLNHDAKNKLFIIAERILTDFPNASVLSEHTTSETIVKAAFTTNMYVKKYRKEV